MKLFQHPDFRDAVVAASEYFARTGLTEQLIEKDYYVTEALRIVATRYPTQIIFKGGTSLSKGWQLIERFSEDIDLFLDRDAFVPRLGENKTDKQLKTIETEVSQHPGLILLSNESKSKRGIYRYSYFSYSQQFLGISAIANRVFLETGTRSGTYPTQSINLSSYIAQFLRETGESLEAEDESSFPMLLLHFRRTFVEKLFTIHSKVIQYQQNGTLISTQARHYYDLFYLAQKPEVRQMLQSEEYNDIKRDCEKISQKYFKDSFKPESLSFSNSSALFPTKELRQTLANEYKQQCQNLCYGNYPLWEQIESCFEELRNLL
jgi:predicted nucleotidyltransferase component of viral defense system